MKKLVRDRIPEIVPDAGEFVTLSNLEYRQSLRDKLIEEAKEVKLTDTRASLVEELGDLEEVLRAILTDASITYEEMDSIRQSKIAQRGNFENKIALIN